MEAMRGGKWLPSREIRIDNDVSDVGDLGGEQGETIQVVGLDDDHDAIGVG
jgi:hypothetical protein